MTLDTLLSKLNYYSGKDKRGKTFKISEFNMLLPTVQDTIYGTELDKLVVLDVKDIPADRLSISPLRPFKKQANETVDDGYFPLPADYVRYISISRGFRNMDVLTENEFNTRRTSVMRRPLIRPFCYITGTDIMTCPTNVGDTELQYLRKPLVPYFDYCQDGETMNEIFMPVGSYIALEDTLYNLYDPAGLVIASDVTKDLVTFPYTSKTVELEWEPVDHDMFVMAMLALVGINIQMNELTQYAEAKQNA